MRLCSVKFVLVGCLVVGAATFVAAAEQPQGPGPVQGAGGGQPPLKNIKVLPKDWTRPQVQQLMQTFVESLGVAAPKDGCGHCHVADPNAPPPLPGRGPAFDFSLETNANKDISRKMIQMVMAVNADYLKDIGEPMPTEKVTCYTCHNGAEKPAIAPPNGWARGNFTLIPPGPTVPARGAGGAGGGRGAGAPAPNGAPAGPGGN